MSQLEAIAGRLRALAQDTSPLSSNIQAAARQLKSIGQQVESLSRTGVNTGPLLAALRQAETQAQSAANAAAQVKSEGVAWADHLARGGAGSTNLTSDNGAYLNTESNSSTGYKALEAARREIPAGFAFLGDGDGDHMHRWASDLQPSSSELAVVIHGNPDSVGIKHKNGSVTFATAQELNDALPNNDKVIRLYSCNTGQKNDGLAKQLANIRDQIVIAPTHNIYTMEGGASVVGDYDPVTNLFTPGTWVYIPPEGRTAT